jgi:hypothetical protein
MSRHGQGSEADAQANTVAADLIAVLVAVTAARTGAEPRVLTVRDATALPAGPFQTVHRSLQAGLRTWVEEQTHHPLGYVEQLYTFADSDRAQDGGHAISISYLGLTREDGPGGGSEAGWRNWYEFFPWEDHRAGAPPLIAQAIVPRLAVWAEAGGPAARDRERRVAITFGTDGRWNEELVLQRYELLFEAGLIAEAHHRLKDAEPPPPPLPGREMVADHRRIVATGIARLRAKIKYRPVVFELMPPAFTLLQLQRAVEAIAGRTLHKQNFRRLIEQQELVEETGAVTQDTGGRPAKLFRFRRPVLDERHVIGTKLPLSPA